MSKPKQLKCNPRNVKNARYVLATPKEIFWPVLQDDSAVINNFEKILGCAKTVHPNLNWFETRKLSKEERRSKIKEFFTNLPNDVLDSHNNAMKLRENLAIGVNEVTRALEQTNLACCLVSGNAKPKLLVSHLIDLAKAKRIPILVLNSLKEKVKASLGHGSLAIGFKNEILENSNHQMYELCTDIVNSFNKEYRYDDEGSTVIEKDTICAPPPVMINSHTKECPDVSDLQIDDIYLYRKTNSSRVFKPNEIMEDELEENEINLSTERDENEVEPSIKRRCYEPPTVKRIQSNPNKNRFNKKKKKRFFSSAI